MTTFTAIRSLTSATCLAIAALAGGADPASATQAKQYCFYENNNVNVFVGDMKKGFTAHAAGRPGNSLYYTRVGNTHRYVGETGAIYSFFSNGDVSWQDGNRTIWLHRC
jgi:ABC-type sugar transport system substrate-binding protein